MADDRYSSSKPFDSLSARSLAGKREYVRGLEERPEEEKLSLLVECLCDESWYMRELAEEALDRCGEAAVPALLPLLGQGLWYTRASAARVLGRLGSRTSIPQLLAMMDDANATVVDAAGLALADVARRGGAAALARALYRQPPDARQRELAHMTGHDRPLGERLAKLLNNAELMQMEVDEPPADDSPIVRQSEEGVEWEVLTGPPPAPAPKRDVGDGGAGSAAGA
jgi:HEAT repeat protein